MRGFHPNHAELWLEMMVGGPIAPTKSVLLAPGPICFHTAQNNHLDRVLRNMEWGGGGVQIKRKSINRVGICATGIGEVEVTQALLLQEERLCMRSTDEKKSLWR